MAENSIVVVTMIGNKGGRMVSRITNADYKDDEQVSELVKAMMVEARWYLDDICKAAITISFGAAPLTPAPSAEWQDWQFKNPHGKDGWSDVASAEEYRDMKAMKVTMRQKS